MKTIIFCFCLCFCLGSAAQITVKGYPERKIPLSGIAGKKLLDKAVVIPAIDINATVRKWEVNKQSKFAEPIPVNIWPLQEGVIENNGYYVISRLKITAENAYSTTIYFDKLKLSKNTEVYIYNEEGTVIAGPITEQENIKPGRIWGSNVFNSSNIIIETKTLLSEQPLNELHVSKILYGIDPKLRPVAKKSDSLMIAPGPGVGLSSPCNVNAICNSSWGDERRGVAQVYDDNADVAFSAFLVMNTCNSTKPYVLTAQHCTNAVDVSNCTFEFLWFSSTCNPTTAEYSTYLFNGASLKAQWDQTDFALLELDDPIPAYMNLAYLGWSRSSTAPNGAVGIHHPMGDIMKISVENDQSTVGTILTYSNKAWRVQWDDGIVEHGSSGSPLFDLNHKVVGQLYSNTQPDWPCNQMTGGTNYGRFDLSWDGGGTSASRLKDWLDPINADPSSMNTTYVGSLVPNISFDISGLDFICSNETYTVPNIPSSGISITWQVLQGTTIVSSSTSGNSITLTKVANGAIELDAIITNLCTSEVKYLKKQILVGTGTTGFFWLHGQRFDYTATGPGNYFGVCPNEELWFEPYFGSGGSPASSNVWTITGNYTLLSPSLNETTLKVQTASTVNSPFFISYQYYSNTCGGWSDIAYGGANTMNCDGGEEPYFTHPSDDRRISDASTIEKIKTYPNPAKTTLIIDLPEDNPQGNFKLYDIKGNEVIKGKIEKKMNIINVSSLTGGVYVLILTVNGKSQTTKVVISK